MRNMVLFVNGHMALEMAIQALELMTISLLVNINLP